MKKIKLILITICIMIMVAGCSKQSDSENMPNPNQQYNLLEDINEKVGGNLTKPNIETIEDDDFTIIDGEYQIAQYRFHVKDVKYCYRFSKAPLSFDISGYYVDGKLLFSEDDYGVCFVNPKDGVRAARWQAEEGQYVLLAEGNIEQDEFTNTVYSLTDITGTVEVDINDMHDAVNFFTSSVEEDGDNIVYTTVPKENAEDQTIQRVIYVCKGEKIVRIDCENIYQDEQAAQDFYKEYNELYPSYKLEINGKVVKMVLSENAEGLEDYKRSDLLKQLKESAEYANR